MLRSYAWLLFCVTVWGSNIVVGAVLVREFPPLLLAACRLLFTTSCYFLFALTTGRLVRLARKEWGYLLFLGAINILINQMSFFIGIQYADTTTAALILALSPITVGIFASLFLKEPFTLRMAVGSAAALAGVFFVVGKGEAISVSAGDLWMIAAMLSSSVSMIVTRKWVEFRDPFVVTSYTTATGTVLLIPTAVMLEPVSGLLDSPLWAWALLFGSALVMQVIANVIWNREMRTVGAGKASLFLNMQPFVAMVLGYLVLGTTVTAIQAVGATLIVGGVLIATTKAGRSVRSGTARKTGGLSSGPSG